MRRADRLFQIVQHLRGGRLMTAAQLAERLEVSPRTIYRDIADLCGSGVPIDGEAGIGYLMREGYDLPPLMFTEPEIIALVAGARMIQAWGGAHMAEGAEEALVKINAVLPDRARQRAENVSIHAAPPFYVDAELRARIDRLEAAAEGRRRLQFNYLDSAGGRTTRVVQPLGLWFWGRVWTLVGWCELRDDFRTFRIDRMEDLQDEGGFRPEKGKTLRDFFERDMWWE